MNLHLLRAQLDEKHIPYQTVASDVPIGGILAHVLSTEPFDATILVDTIKGYSLEIRLTSRNTYEWLFLRLLEEL